MRAVAALFLAAASAQLKPCPPTNTSRGNANCFADEACCTAMYFGASGCEVALPSGGTYCCAPGPPLNVSTTLPNCLIIGDSVSDQYTPSVASLLKDKCLVQHAPWVGGGSADNVANGLFNLLHCRWLRTALRPDLPVAWDIIQFVRVPARARGRVRAPLRRAARLLLTTPPQNVDRTSGSTIS